MRPASPAFARLLLAVLLAAPLVCMAQEEEEETFSPGYDDRFLQTSTPLVYDTGILGAIFQHRFLQPVNRAGGNNLGGLDSGANIGLAVNYVPVTNLGIEAYRASTNGDYEFSLKYTFLRPTRKLPLAIGVRAGVDWLTKAELPEKVAGFGQLLVAVTLGDRVTVAAAPTFVSNTPLFENVWNVPVIVQLKLPKRLFATAEYVFRNGDNPGSVGQWSFAVEKAVYHHRFGVWIGNSGATTVDQLAGGDFAGGVTESNLRLGFNIVRNFEIK